jgi:hypothetical protein
MTRDDWVVTALLVCALVSSVVLIASTLAV